MAAQEVIILTDEQQAAATALLCAANYAQDTLRHAPFGVSEGRRRAFADVAPVLRELTQSTVDAECATWPEAPLIDIARVAVGSALAEVTRGARLRRQWRAGRLLTQLSAHSQDPDVRARIGLNPDIL